MRLSQFCICISPQSGEIELSSTNSMGMLTCLCHSIRKMFRVSLSWKQVSVSFQGTVWWGSFCDKWLDEYRNGPPQVFHHSTALVLALPRRIFLMFLSAYKNTCLTKVEFYLQSTFGTAVANWLYFSQGAQFNCYVLLLNVDIGQRLIKMLPDRQPQTFFEVKQRMMLFHPSCLYYGIVNCLGFPYFMFSSKHCAICMAIIHPPLKLISTTLKVPLLFGGLDFMSIINPLHFLHFS